jgi:hypothetical protein
MTTASTQYAPMKPLKDRIEECKKQAAEIIAAYPGVTNVTFELTECDIEEIRQFDKDPRECGGKLRGLVNSYQGNATIFADTKPFKSVKPLEYEF